MSCHQRHYRELAAQPLRGKTFVNFELARTKHTLLLPVDVLRYHDPSRLFSKPRVLQHCVCTSILCQCVVPFV